jgi:hypothetical protein
MYMQIIIVIIISFTQIYVVLEYLWDGKGTSASYWNSVNANFGEFFLFGEHETSA